MTRALVLLSAGLDSSYNLFRAARELNVVLALTFDYGQKAAAAETRCARALCHRLKIRHQVISAPWFREFTTTSLVGEGSIPTGVEVAIDDATVSHETMKAVWVPNRNGIFLNIAAGFAEGLGVEYVVPGFNLEEAATFPDNSQEYLESLNRCFTFSTRNHVEVKCFSTSMTKVEIVRAAIALDLPLGEIWPCYHAREKWCGSCESCQRFRRAVIEVGVEPSLSGRFA